jgi:hypothetical protein
MSHPALTQLRALRYFDQIPALDPQQLDWLLLEDSMTKRFEQQGKTVTVTLIQEGFVSGDEIASELPLLPKRNATGCVKFYSVPMASRGLPGGRWCRSPPFPGRSWRCSSWGKRRWGVIFHLV